MDPNWACDLRGSPKLTLPAIPPVQEGTANFCIHLVRDNP